MDPSDRENQDMYSIVIDILEKSVEYKLTKLL